MLGSYLSMDHRPRLSYAPAQYTRLSFSPTLPAVSCAQPSLMRLYGIAAGNRDIRKGPDPVRETRPTKKQQ